MRLKKMGILFFMFLLLSSFVPFVSAGSAISEADRDRIKKEYGLDESPPPKIHLFDGNIGMSFAPEPIDRSPINAMAHNIAGKHRGPLTPFITLVLLLW
ncbi:hypothetical protein [Paenibacillus sp. 481]|uniref:hypothetical protein n=1 Tax=Paenibacillus sp. 481 TaxID=2835869 RepID=UPI001E40E3BA|nr:hypothetical protein [Paenibacillus sp. 481]UHA74793.1 hypothetical protein KIK04_06960 [Paenibacillus sp. 481]